MTDNNSNEPLNYHHTVVGEYLLSPSVNGRELVTYSNCPVDLSNIYFDELKRKLHQTRLSFKILKTGQIIIFIPRGAKYGYLLGWIAWTYYHSKSNSPEHDTHRTYPYVTPSEL